MMRHAFCGFISNRSILVKTFHPRKQNIRKHDLRTKFINSFEACRVSFLNLEFSRFRVVCWGWTKRSTNIWDTNRTWHYNASSQECLRWVRTFDARWPKLGWGFVEVAEAKGHVLLQTQGGVQDQVGPHPKHPPSAEISTKSWMKSWTTCIETTLTTGSRGSGQPVKNFRGKSFCIQLDNSKQ